MPELLIENLTIEVVQVTPNTRWCFITVAASNKQVGVGEATLQRHEAEVLLFADKFLPKLVGQTVTPSLADTRQHDELAESAVVSALSQALWDVQAKTAGHSVTEQLGGRLDGSVKVYANINRRTTNRSASGFSASARAAYEAGHRAFKIAPFDEVLRGTGQIQPPSTLVNGIERIAAVRQTIGTKCDLMVDCHWRLTPELTALVIEQCRKHNLYWLECPLPETPENLSTISAVRKTANAAGVLLAGCELCVGIDGFKPFLDAGAYDVVMPDIKYIGSIEDMERLWQVVSRAGVQLSPHNPSGPISHAATLHVCNALSREIRMEMQFDETPLFWSMAPGVPQPVNGKSALPSSGGLGCALTSEVLRQHSALRKVYV